MPSHGGMGRVRASPYPCLDHLADTNKMIEATVARFAMVEQVGGAITWLVGPTLLGRIGQMDPLCFLAGRDKKPVGQAADVSGADEIRLEAR